MLMILPTKKMRNAKLRPEITSRSMKLSKMPSMNLSTATSSSKNYGSNTCLPIVIDCTTAWIKYMEKLTRDMSED